MDFSFSDLNFNSVENLPGYEARAAFTVNSASVFREDVDIVPTIIDDKLSYVPWGGDNQMPFDLLALVEKDETLATCQCFNAEVCYGSGLQYCTIETTAKVKNDVEDFLLDNDLAAYFLGICQDFKHFGFAVSVLILNEDGTKIVRLLRKEACYCHFTPVDSHGRISKILYANWRKAVSDRLQIEEIDLLDPTSPWRDLKDKLAKKSKTRKFAIVSRIPTVDSTYYPIHIAINQYDMILPDKRPQDSDFVNLTDYSLKCPKGHKRFYAYVHFLDYSYCLWSNIFAKTRSAALAQVLLKFADCGEYIAGINIHGD